MKTLAVIISVCGLLVIGLAFAFAADDAHKEGEPMPEYGPPQQIKDLAFMVGDWLYRGKMRMQPDQPWQEHEADISYAYVAGGGALQTIFHGMMFGQEMHGFGVTAFNRETGEWQDTWVDNFSGHMSYYTGKEQEGQRVVSGIDIMQGQKMHTRVTTYDIGKTAFKWKMENSMDGQEWFVSMEGQYTKK